MTQDARREPEATGDSPGSTGATGKAVRATGDDSGPSGAERTAVVCGHCATRLVFGRPTDPAEHGWDRLGGVDTCYRCCRVVFARVRGRKRTRAVEGGTGVPTNVPGSNGMYSPENGYQAWEYPGEDRKGGTGGNRNGAAQLGFMSPAPRGEPEPPEFLRGFRQAMLRVDKYRPTQDHYDRMVEMFGHVPFLDPVEQARVMLEWFRLKPKRYRELTVIGFPRFVERWFTRATGDAWKIARTKGWSYDQWRRVLAKQGTPGAEGQPVDRARQLRYGGGSVSDDQAASVDAFERRGRAHYDD